MSHTGEAARRLAHVKNSLKFRWNRRSRRGIGAVLSTVVELVGRVDRAFDAPDAGPAAVDKPVETVDTAW